MGFVKVNTEKTKEQKTTDAPIKGSRTPAVFLTPKNGITYRIRILPPWTAEGPNAELPYKKVHQHWDLTGGKRANCPAQLREDKCFVCEQREQLAETGHPDDASRSKKLKPNRRFVYQVIDRDDPVFKATDKEVQEKQELIGEAKIKFLSIGWMAHEKMLDLFASAHWGDVTDPFEGYDLEMSRTGEGLNTTYSFLPIPEKCPVFPEKSEMETLEKYMGGEGNLDEHRMWKSNTYDETRALYYGEDTNSQNSLPGSAPSAGALPEHSAPPPAPGLNPEAFEQLITGGAVMSKEQLVQNGVAGFTKEDDVPWCYSQEPDPKEQFCFDCALVPHCAATFRAVTGLKWFKGPAMEAETAPTPGKPAPGKPAPGKPAPTPAPQAAPASEAPAEEKPKSVDDVEAYLEKQAEQG